MEKLPEFIENTKAGFKKGEPGRTANLLKRDRKVAMYLRSDNMYEVGIVHVYKAAIVFDVSYPEREKYWNNEDIGTLAICTPSLSIAEKAYKVYCDEQTVPDNYQE